MCCVVRKEWNGDRRARWVYGLLTKFIVSRRNKLVQNVFICAVQHPSTLYKTHSTINAAGPLNDADSLETRPVGGFPDFILQIIFPVFLWHDYQTLENITKLSQ